MEQKLLIQKLKQGEIVGMPTDTIYGLVGLASNTQTVEAVYTLRKRNKQKPCIILIGDISDVERFGIKLSDTTMQEIANYWPGPVSIIFDCPLEEFSYLHRGTQSLAFRLPDNPNLQAILRETGPLIAPSLNWEGEPPAETIDEARKYFGDSIDYVDGGRIIGKPSKVVRYSKETNDFTTIRD